MSEKIDIPCDKTVSGKHLWVKLDTAGLDMSIILGRCVICEALKQNAFFKIEDLQEVGLVGFRFDPVSVKYKKVVEKVYLCLNHYSFYVEDKPEDN